MRGKLLIGAVLLLLASVALAGDAPWFDMKNCGFCKHLMDDPEMLNHCTWEHHKIDNGMVVVTTVEDAYLPSYQKAMAVMEEVGKNMEAGEMVPMCGMCQAMGSIFMKGAKYTSIDTKHGSVALFTSDNPEVVKEIHAFVDRNNEEMAKMEAAEVGHDKDHDEE